MTAYERSDLSAKRIAWLAAGLFVSLLVSVAVIAGLFAILPHRKATNGHTEQATAGPRLEVHEGSDRAAVDRAAEQRLHSYGWADRSHELARIPIDRAMQLLAAHGWLDDQPKQGTP
ncbi:MAG TPA: hypothetical protein VFB13_01895 [Reyranella sp.]|jgi:hypothetical protein|nr:hypothetical protein [Reyranella sp.]